MNRLLIIVISWNRPDFLRQTLSSLFAQSESELHDVVVVDNGSDIATTEILRSEMRLHGTRLLPVNRGLNVAVKTALEEWLTPEHRWVLVSDADMEYRRPIRRAAEFLDHWPEIGAVSLQHSPEHKVHAELEWGGCSWPLKWSERGCALLLRSETLLELCPLPVENLKDFDWWVCRDAPHSLQSRGMPIAVAVGGARHLGWRAGDSTWQHIEIPEFAEFQT
jgi:glycosyltransferase involved in cell wall biosynthesis